MDIFLSVRKVEISFLLLNVSSKSKLLSVKLGQKCETVIFMPPNLQLHSSSGCCHFTLTSSFSHLFKYALTSHDALSPLVIWEIATLNVFFIVLWHYKLTVAFIKQEMRKGTVNIGIWIALRIPIKSQWSVGLSCAAEWAMQLSAWWICIITVSFWTSCHAGFTESSQSSAHCISCTAAT